MNNKINKIIKNAYENIPFYNNYFDVPPKNLKDFPIISKRIISENYNDFLNVNVNSDVLIEEYTSGSTGMPFKTYKSPRELIHAQKTLWNLRSSYLSHILNRRLLQFSYSDFGMNYISKNKKAYHKCNLNNILKVTLSQINETNLAEILRIISSFSPEWIRSSPSIIYTFCLKVINEKCVEECKSAFKNVAFIELSGENFNDYMIPAIQKVYEGKIINHYGSREVWPIAYSCYEGNLHFCENNVFIELLNTEKYCKDNSIGEVCITALNQYAFPYIRYKNGDVIKISNNKCKCGKTGYILSIEGRSNSIFEVCGKKFGVTIFSRMITTMRNNDIIYIDNYYIIQKSEHHFKIVCEIEQIKDKAYKEKMNCYLRKYVDKGIVLDVDIVDRVPQNYIGKQTYFYSYMKEDLF